MSALHLVVWALYFCAWSLLQTQDCDTFTPALWRLLVTSLTAVFQFFFTTFKMFWSSTAVFLGWPAHTLFLVHQCFFFFSGHSKFLYVPCSVLVHIVNTKSKTNKILSAWKLLAQIYVLNTENTLEFTWKWSEATTQLLTYLVFFVHVCLNYINIGHM